MEKSFSQCAGQRSVFERVNFDQKLLPVIAL